MFTQGQKFVVMLLFSYLAIFTTTQGLLRVFTLLILFFPQHFGAWLQGSALLQPQIQHWCWVIAGSQSVFHYIWKVLDGAEVRTLSRNFKVFHTKLRQNFLYGPGFVHRGSVMLKENKFLLKLSTNSRGMLVFSSMHTVAEGFSFTGTKDSKIHGCIWTGVHIPLVV